MSSSTLEQFLDQLRRLDVQLWVEGDRLRYKAPKDALTPEILIQLKEQKAEIINFLQQIQAKVQTVIPPLSPTTRDGILPLSFAQQRLWFLEQLEPGSSIYNMSRVYRLIGVLNISALEQSFQAMIQRHEVLRTIFTTVEGQPVQKILPNIPFHLSGDRCNDRSIQDWLNRESQKPFDLSQAPLLRAKILRITETEHILLVTIHHIVSDGWSMGILVQELSHLYSALVNQTAVSLPELSIQYVDFSVWQRQWLSGTKLEHQINYWQQQLTNLPPFLELPTDRPRPAIQTFSGSAQTFIIPLELTQQLKSLSQQQGVTLFMTLLATFGLLLSRYSRQEDLAIGSSIANRQNSQIERLIGCLVNMLVLRMDLSENPTVSELLQRAKKIAIDAYAHQDLPFEKLVEELQPERHLSHSPLFQVAFSMQNVPQPPLNLTGLEVTPLELEKITSQFDLTLYINETIKGIEGQIEYNTDLFDHATINRMIGHFQCLLEGFVANPQQKVFELSILTVKEQQQILGEWNQTKTNYPQDQCIHQLFEKQVAKTPNNIALVFEDQTLTYQELNQKANQLAHYLQQIGVKPEDLIGICVERSLEMIISLLAILKAGGAYLPLDHNYPQERLQWMLEDAQTSIIITTENLIGKLPKNQARLVLLDTNQEAIQELDPTNLPCHVQPDSLVYVIYTSGSTGKPKGVSILHKGVVRLVNNTNYINFSAEDVFLQLSTISFDASTFEIWGCLLNGGKLVIMPPHTPSLTEIGTAIKEHKVTTIWLTAGLFHLIVDENINDLKPIKNLLAGGDVLSLSHCRKVLQELPQCTLINGYGPTENTTFTCCYPIEYPSQIINSIPIGKPIANTQVYILDSHLIVTPVGIPGELYIGGDGLARGYLNRPDLNKEKFISNPFSENSDSRLYKTGDLVRYLPDGNIEFLGRLDNQVKIRGFRIELGEIEAYLSQHPLVKENVVVTFEKHPNNKILVAYLVVHTAENFEISELRQFLKERLPDYMIPSDFVILESLPLNPNGKVDRRALPSPDLKPESSSFLAPRDDVEAQLAKIWENVLGIENLSVTDNFFDLGGHSLLAIKLFNAINQTFHKKLLLATLFQAPTIEQLANLIKRSDKSSSWSSLVAIQPQGSKPPIFCVHGGGGNVLIFRELSQYLGSDQPFYGLQAQGIDGEQQPLTRIEDMAEVYLTEILSFQPSGHYIISGYCTGCLVALEIAHRLRALGKQVALLGLIVPSPMRFSHNDPVFYREKNYLVRLLELPGKLIKRGFVLVLKKRIQKIWYRLLRLLGFKVKLPPVHFSVAEACKQAAKHYLARTYPERVVIFATEDQIARPSLFQRSWRKLSSEDVEIHQVPGLHGDDHPNGCLREPNVQVLAAKLKAILEQIADR
jgi:aspartate racemase